VKSEAYSLPAEIAAYVDLISGMRSASLFLETYSRKRATSQLGDRFGRVAANHGEEDEESRGCGRARARHSCRPSHSL
jgi:hypothetical protein